ncbi:MAG: ComEC/Rec2 family competence protein [Candidatus Omnitrophota bacterium]
MEQFAEQIFHRNSRRPFLWICLIFILGIVISQYSPIPLYVYCSITFIFIAITSFFIYAKAYKADLAAFFLLLAVFGSGAVHAKNFQTFSACHLLKHSGDFYDGPVLLEGKVISDVEKRVFWRGEKIVFTLGVRAIKTKSVWREREGKVLVNLFRDCDIRYGDEVTLEGKLYRPFNFINENNFSYREFLYRKGIAFMLSVKKNGFVEVGERDNGHPLAALSFRMKHYLSDQLERYLSHEDAGMMQALLLGERGDIPKTVYELYKLSGVAHVIAISGFNIAIVSCGIFFVLKMFPIARSIQYFLNILLLIFYAFLAGGQPPVARATIMAVVFLLSFIIERQTDAINLLSLAAFVILLLNPLVLFEVGFQLSFLSVLSIILFYQPMINAFYRCIPSLKSGEKDMARLGPIAAIKVKFIRFLVQSVALSLAAYFGVVVLIGYYFRIITPVTILANLVIVPLTSLAIYLGMGLLTAGVIIPFAAAPIAACISMVLHLTVACVAFLADLPFAYFKLDDFSLKIVFFYYGVVVLAFLIGYIFKKQILKEETV